jgi:hypothetical protein
MIPMQRQEANHRWMGRPSHPPQRQPGGPAMIDEALPSVQRPRRLGRANSDPAAGVFRMAARPLVRNKADLDRAKGQRGKGTEQTDRRMATCRTKPISGDRQQGSGSWRQGCGACRPRRRVLRNKANLPWRGAEGTEAQSRGQPDSHVRGTKPIVLQLPTGSTVTCWPFWPFNLEVHRNKAKCGRSRASGQGRAPHGPALESAAGCRTARRIPRGAVGLGASALPYYNVMRPGVA